MHSSGDQPPDHRPRPPLRPSSVRDALRVLESVAGHRDGVSERRLAEETGLPPAYLAQLLWTLHRERYLERLGDGTYAAGEALVLLSSGGSGSGAAGGSGDGSGCDGRERVLRERLWQRLARLRDTIGAAVYLGRYHDGELEIVQHADSPRTPAVTQWVDFRSAGHATALGKCLLGQLDHGARRDHLARHGAARLTPHTITDERVLLTVLDRQPPAVPVLDLQEYAVGTVCAAVPVTAGSTVGALGLSLPVEQAHRLRRAAEALSRQAAPVLLALSL
ncbi:MAG TPA: IclR family transcriptional regulator C-terminal domain-containing protein [Streptomyces sp.]|nr:IclR family transcriptional regulator C-terminal domain-containing protein [Streptomyces sp.]